MGRVDYYKQLCQPNRQLPMVNHSHQPVGVSSGSSSHKTAVQAIQHSRKLVATTKEANWALNQATSMGGGKVPCGQQAPKRRKGRLGVSHDHEVILISVQLTSHAGLVQVLSYPMFLLVLSLTYPQRDGGLSQPPARMSQEWVLNPRPVTWWSTALPTELSWPDKLPRTWQTTKRAIHTWFEWHWYARGNNSGNNKNKRKWNYHHWKCVGLGKESQGTKSPISSHKQSHWSKRILQNKSVKKQAHKNSSRKHPHHKDRKISHMRQTTYKTNTDISRTIPPWTTTETY